MSVLAPPRPRPPEQPAFTKGRRRRPLRSLLPTESVILFGLAWVVYGVLGWLVVLHWHIVVGDAVSRLAHAYFVWFNEPSKLTAVGFVWPPLMTLVLLPGALVKPLATSLLALPLTSALFGAGLLVVLDRTLALLQLPRGRRLALLALVGLNPMILYYAANGMAETVYLFLLALATHSFLRWYLEPNLLSLVLASTALTLGVLTRYEILFWAFVFGIAIMGVLIQRRAPRAQLEATAIAFFAPISYGLCLWVFFNWLILGDPLHWLSSEVSLTFVETRAAETREISYAIGDVVGRTLSLTWQLFPATFFVIAALLAVFVVKRELVSLLLAAAIALNPLTTAVIAVATKTDVVFQLRYNLRAVPLALVGLAWLCWLAPARLKLGVWAASAALLAVSIPQTWQAMQSYERQALEQAFTRALSSGEDQEGTRSFGSGIVVGNAPERGAAAWLLDHAHGRDAVLADDEEAFAVMLYTGRPDLFFDRIDHGDDPWNAAVSRPQGRVDFLLVAKHKPDLIRARYPRVLEAPTPGLERVFDNERWAIFRVVG